MGQKIHGRYEYAGYIILPVEIPGLPGAITVHNEELRHQPEFHVSLIGVKHLASEIAAEQHVSPQEVVDKLLQAFSTFTENQTLEIETFLDEFRFVTKDNRAAVFVRCKVKNLPELFAYLRQQTGYKLELPPAHVTLYARPGKGIRGIGVISAEQLAQTQDVGAAIPSDVRRALKL